MFLASSPLVKKYDLSSVLKAGYGAAPLPKELESKLSEVLKLKSVGQGAQIYIEMKRVILLTLNYFFHTFKKCFLG